MMIDDAIRSAEADHQIYSLLADYIETLQLGAERPERLTTPPISGMDDLRTRFRQLMIELDNASTQIADKRPVIKQALFIYEAALSRLQFLDNKMHNQIDKHMQERSMNGVRRELPDVVDTLSIS